MKFAPAVLSSLQTIGLFSTIILRADANETTALVTCGGGATNKKCIYDPKVVDKTARYGARCCSPTPFFMSEKREQHGCTVYGGTITNIPGPGLEEGGAEGLYCPWKLTYEETDLHCKALGAEICTEDQLNQKCAKAMGCHLNWELVWTYNPTTTVITDAPTSAPTKSVTTSAPTAKATSTPTSAPTAKATSAPTSVPTVEASSTPTIMSSSSPTEYTACFLGIGLDNKLYTKDDIAGTTWDLVPKENDLEVVSVTIMDDGKILGAGLSDQLLYTRETLISPWVQVPNSCCAYDVTQLNDGSILVIGNNNDMFTKPSLAHVTWGLVANSGGMKTVTQLQDGSFVGVSATDKNLYTRPTLVYNGWDPVVSATPTCCAVDLFTMADGTILGVGENTSLNTKDTPSSAWVQYFNSGPVKGVAAFY